MPKEKKRGWGKWLMQMFLILLGLLLLSVALVPKATRFEPVKRALVAVVNQGIPGEIEVGTVDLNWFGPQEIKDFILNDQENKTVLEFASFTTSSSLFSLLWNRTYEGNHQVVGLETDLYEIAPGISNVVYALRPDIHWLSKLPDRKDAFFVKMDAAINWSWQKGLQLLQINGHILNGKKGSNFNVNFQSDLTSKETPNLAFVFDHFPTVLLDEWFPKLGRPLHMIFGETLTASMESNEQSQIQIKITSSLLSATIGAEFIQDHLIFLPSQINYTMTPALLDWLENMQLFSSDLELTKDTPAIIQIDKLKLPFSLDLTEVDLDAKAFFDGLEISDPTLPSPLKFDSLKGNVHISSTTPVLELEVKGVSGEREEQVNISVDLTAPEQLFKKGMSWELITKGDVTVALDGVSSTWLEPFLEFPIPERFGKRFNFHLSSHPNQEGTDWNIEMVSVKKESAFLGHFDPTKGLFEGKAHYRDLQIPLKVEKKGDVLFLDVKSPAINATAKFHYGETITLYNQEPALFQLHLTPKTFSSLSSAYELLDPLNAVFKLEDLSIPFREGHYMIEKTSFQGSATIDQIHFNDQRSQKEGDFEKVELRLKATQLLDNFDLSLRAKDRKGEWQRVNLHVEEGEHFFQEGDWEHLVVSLEARLKNAPLPSISRLLFLNPKTRRQLASLVGDEADANVSIHLKEGKGPFQLNLRGTNGGFQASGSFHEGGIILEKPLLANLTLTTRSADTIDDLFPFLRGIKGAKAPWKLRIEPQGFYLPVKKFQLSQLQIGKASLDMGKTQFQQGGPLGLLLTSLNSKENIPLFDIWFTPLYFQINNGKLYLHRCDFLLANRYPIALWGEINLVQDKVNVILGLSGLTLDRALGITGFKEENILQVPLKGTLQNATIDKNKLVKKLTELTIKSKGVEGKIIGGLLGLLDGTEKEKVSPPPPPTTYPFPWSQQREAEKERERPKTPLKKIEKGVQKVLQQIGL